MRQHLSYIYPIMQYYAMFASACHAAPSRVRSQCTSAQFLYLPKRLIFPSNFRRSARHNTFSADCKHDVSNCRMYFMNCITGSAQLHESPPFHVSRHGGPANLVGAVNGSGIFRTARALPPAVCVELGRWNSLPGSNDNHRKPGTNLLIQKLHHFALASARFRAKMRTSNIHQCSEQVFQESAKNKVL